MLACGELIAHIVTCVGSDKVLISYV